jgi:hypothetical protein
MTDVWKGAWLYKCERSNAGEALIVAEECKFEYTFPQGLKPRTFFGVIGTTEVVPCYKTPSVRVFLRSPQGLKPSLLLSIYVRAKARTLHRIELFRSL